METKAAMAARQASRAFGAIAVAALVALAPAAAAQKLYKWTDENGKVHYTDKAPDPSRGGVQLDKQGRPVGKIEPAPTPEQARAKAAEEERRREAAKEQEITARRDRALLASYTTEAEIDLARARAVGTVESQIQSAQAYLAQLTKRKTELDARKAKLGGSPMPPQLERESASVDAEYAKNSDLVVQKQRELAAVTARYDGDKQRWRELKAQQESSAAAAANGNRAATPAAAAQPTPTPTPAPAPAKK